MQPFKNPGFPSAPTSSPLNPPLGFPFLPLLRSQHLYTHFPPWINAWSWWETWTQPGLSSEMDKRTAAWKMLGLRDIGQGEELSVVWAVVKAVMHVGHSACVSVRVTAQTWDHVCEYGFIWVEVMLNIPVFSCSVHGGPAFHCPRTMKTIICHAFWIYQRKLVLYTKMRRLVSLCTSSTHKTFMPWLMEQRILNQKDFATLQDQAFFLIFLLFSHELLNSL